jgi:hypothetical protein
LGGKGCLVICAFGNNKCCKPPVTMGLGHAGDLLPEEYQAIVDIHARRRLNFLMDIMCRMEIIRGLLISDNSHVSRIERSVYIVKPDVFFEEPRKVTVPGYVSSPPLRPAKPYFLLSEITILPIVIGSHDD